MSDVLEPAAKGLIKNHKPSSNLGISAEIRGLIQAGTNLTLDQSAGALDRIGGSLEVYCRVDLESRQIVEVASVATPFKGYEALLPGRSLGQIGLVSSMASGLCGGVHATASALCLEMALGLTPPPLGIILRNLLLSCQYFNDNTMHLFVLAGPDYSQAVFERTNPEIWQKAQRSLCRSPALHGYRYRGDIMADLNKGTGKLYKEALRMASLARQAYILLGGKYPHSETIVPGGVSLTVDADKLRTFRTIIEPFAAYSAKSAALWDDIFDFLTDAQPAYQNLGRSPASMMDFGQWDHPDHYDASYQNCDSWGRKRWASPAIILDGKLECDRLSLLNAGLEEGLAYSHQAQTVPDREPFIKEDPLGNPLSARHPWNKRTGKGQQCTNPDAYSWGSSLTWRRQGFEVGAYARLYLTAVCQNITTSPYLAATGKAMAFSLPRKGETARELCWHVPAIWNTFERNRARAYVLAFNFAVTLENIDLAMIFVMTGETQTMAHLAVHKSGQQLGVGLWGASRGFLAHWAVIRDQVVDTYQISIPSRVNIGTRTVAGELGPLEKALTHSPIIESCPQGAAEFRAIDVQRTIQSFDPCMSCSVHILVNDGEAVIDRKIDTNFPA